MTAEIYGENHDAILILDAIGKIELFSPSAEKLLGYISSDVVGRVLSDVIVPVEVSNSQEGFVPHLISEVITRGAPKSLLVRLSRADHTQFLARLTLWPDRHGSSIRLLCQIRDVTLAQGSDERFVLAVEAAPNAMIMVNSAGSIVLVNTRTEQLFGYTREELLGESVEILLPDSFRKAHLSHRLEYMNDPKPRAMGAGRDLYGRHRDGQLIPVEIGLNPIRMEQEVLVLGAIVDITSRKKLEAELVDRAGQLAERIRELAQRNAELDEFTSVASHDLQEPLRKLVAYSRLLPDDLGNVASEKAAQDLYFIAEAASRMQNLVQDLLNLHQAGRAAMKYETISVNSCVDAAINQLSILVEERGAIIERDELPTLTGDSTLLTQVFQNLIGNAIKYTTAGTTPYIRITSSMSPDGRTQVLGVKDKGIGIDPKYFSTIFTPLRRLHSREEYPGSGIGLSICKRAVERHGGKLWVESKPGEGSHFQFSIETPSTVSHALT